MLISPPPRLGFIHTASQFLRLSIGLLLHFLVRPKSLNKHMCQSVPIKIDGFLQKDSQLLLSYLSTQDDLGGGWAITFVGGSSKRVPGYRGEMTPVCKIYKPFENGNGPPRSLGKPKRLPCIMHGYEPFSVSVG